MHNMQNRICHVENKINKNKNSVVLQVEERILLDEKPKLDEIEGKTKTLIKNP